MVVLDTHVAVWWTTEPTRLSARAAAAIASADTIGIPSIVFWEIALLVRKKRLQLDMPVDEWAETVQLIPRVQALPLTAEVALAADALEVHADPADRFIVATARIAGARLITKDSSIRRQRAIKTVW